MKKIIIFVLFVGILYSCDPGIKSEKEAEKYAIGKWNLKVTDEIRKISQNAPVLSYIVIKTNSKGEHQFIGTYQGRLIGIPYIGGSWNIIKTDMGYGIVFKEYGIKGITVDGILYFDKENIKKTYTFYFFSKDKIGRSKNFIYIREQKKKK